MNFKRVLALITLMIVGESVFLLPFVVSRIFRPTFLAVFEINNFQLGSAFSVYGMVAMIAYFAGGPIADRFSAKTLIIVSLALTSLGGIVMGAIPSIYTLTLLYGFWGLSTILFFWAAYVKATRQFGGDATQGSAFGSVDGGRGLLAAVLSSSSVILFASLLPVDPADATIEEMSNSLSQIIYLFSGFTLFTCLLVWWFIPSISSSSDVSSSVSIKDITKIIKRPTLWLQAMIVMCAYVGYKCSDIFSLYASDVMNLNDVNSAHVGTVSFWIRPVAALGAGLLGDRKQFSKIIQVCFVIIVAGSLLIGSGWLKYGVEIFMILNIAFISVGIYGLRGLYFALFQEAKFPLIYTGSAAGFVSTIGYLPDIFAGPLIGLVLDNNPGEIGFQYLFLILAGFAILGLVSTTLFQKSVAIKAS